MKKALVVFDTVSGSTGDMAEIIRDTMKNLSVEAAAVENVSSLDAFDTVIIGSPIRFGGFTMKMKRFIKKYRTELSSKKIVLYFSSLYIVRFKEEAMPAVPLYVDPTLNMRTMSRKDATPMDNSHTIGSYYPAVIKQMKGVTPVAIAYFNGRLDPDKLIFVQKIFMKIVTACTKKERVGNFLNPDSVKEGAIFFEKILSV